MKFKIVENVVLVENLEEYKKKHGIKSEPGGNSIGFSEDEQKWYGWSHRATYGFGIGSKVKEGDVGYDESKGAWTATTLEDAKKMAEDFAEGVS